MEPLKSLPQFSAWQILTLVCLFIVTTLGHTLLYWLFPQLGTIINTATMQVLIPLGCIGLMLLFFEQWGVIELKPFFSNSGLTMPLLASFALLYPLLSYF